MFRMRIPVKGLKVSLWLMILTILISFIVPSVLAQPVDASRKTDANAGIDLTYDVDSYFALVNYNEPSNPYIVLNYYFENGSHIRMVHGVDIVIFPSLNLDYQNNVVRIFDKNGKLEGYGFGFRPKSRTYVFMPV